jgi:hypothetical protein
MNDWLTKMLKRDDDDDDDDNDGWVRWNAWLIDGILYADVFLDVLTAIS